MRNIGKSPAPPANRELEDFGRFLEPALLILVGLAEGPRHGYELMKESERLSGQALGPGTLYGAVARLVRRGLIEAIPSTDRRRPYRLTDAGRRLLGAELVRMRDVARLGLTRLASS
ncbi:MAG: PadR family transcriptional regulator [Chloroflexota bacterium]|nr:PadR family transcriptional regulator [Chloroflexota bacterium]